MDDNHINIFSTPAGNKCSYYDASFSLKGSWYLLNCRGEGLENNSSVFSMSIRYVASKPYVDENKIAIWGWVSLHQLCDNVLQIHM